MPFAFLIAGAVFLTAGLRGTSADLIALLKGDLTGQNSFVYWMLSILVIGSIGYVEDLRALSRAFLVLVVVVLILHEGNKSGSGGLFVKFQDAVQQITGTSQGAAA